MSKNNVVLTIPEPGKFELVEKPFPRIKPGYAIIKTEIAAVCLEGTRVWTKHEFEKFHGGLQSDYPDGLGHEGVGVVEEVLPGSNFKPGDRVIVYQGDWCGHCRVGPAPGWGTARPALGPPRRSRGTIRPKWPLDPQRHRKCQERGARLESRAGGFVPVHPGRGRRLGVLHALGG